MLDLPKNRLHAEIRGPVPAGHLGRRHYTSPVRHTRALQPPIATPISAQNSSQPDPELRLQNNPLGGRIRRCDMAFISSCGRAASVVIDTEGGAMSGLSCVSVADFNTKGDGVSDDREALQAAIDACRAGEIKRLLVPCGTYMVSRTQDAGNVGIGLDFSNVHDLTVSGEGPDASVIKMMKTFDKGWRLIRPRDASELVFCDLALDGNWAGEPGDVHIQLTEITSEQSDTADIYFRNVWFKNCRGDGFRTVGNTPGLFVRRCHAQDCRFVNVKRAPVSVQRASIDCSVTRCYIESVTDSAVDFEPSNVKPIPGGVEFDPGILSPARWDISHNTIIHKAPDVDIAVSLVGGAAPGMENTSFCFNKVLGGALDVRSCRGIKIAGNTVVSRAGSSATKPTVNISLSTDTHLAGNTFVRPAGAAAGRVLLIGTDAGLGNDGVLVEGNTLCQYTDDHAVEIRSAKIVTVQANTLRFYGSTTGQQRGFFGTTTIAAPLTGIKIIDNNVVGDASGGTLACGVFVNSVNGTVGPVAVEGNGGTGIEAGAEFTGGRNAPGFTAQPICHGNLWEFSGAAYTGAFGHCPGLEAIVTKTSGNRVTYEGSGTPEGHVTGSIGDEFYRTDGTAGTLLYQKNSGTATKTGWAAVR
jgi:hypothetical protein